jgi:hypothetical protein
VKEYFKGLKEYSCGQIEYWVNEFVLGVKRGFIRGEKNKILRKGHGSHCKSEYKNTYLGIVQGASMSCLLFILLMNDLPLVVKNSITIKYVDDTQIIISGPPHLIEYLKKKIEEDLERIAEWMSKNRLSLNVNKTKMLIIGRPNQLQKTEELEIKFEGTNVQRVTELKILGVMLDDKFDFTSNTSIVSRKCNGLLRMLFPLRDVLSVKCKSIIINAIIMSILNYASIVTMQTNKKNWKSIKLILKRASRFILRKRVIESEDNNINFKHKWLMPKFKHQFEIAKFAYEIVNECAPDYFSEYLDFNQFDERQTRNRTYHDRIPDSKLTSKSIKCKAAKLWLELPQDLKDSRNKMYFKRKVFNYLLSLQIAECITVEEEDINVIV